MSPALEVRDLRIGFRIDGEIVPAVDGISLAVDAGQTVAIVGESGCGKSATALALLRLLPSGGRVLGGSVRLDARELLSLPESQMRDVRGRGLAMIFQEPATSLNPVLTVGHQIIEVLERHDHLSPVQATARATELLRAVGLADPERRLGEYPFQLSGGMKQRVMIAIALAGNPRVLVADEPTTALDVTVQAQILGLLQEVQRARGMGMLLITHDLGVVARMADSVGVMYAGELVETASREVFFGAPRHPYTRGLFAALPDASRRGGSLQTIVGQVPPLRAMPTGCRFAPRCPHAWSLCREVSPPWSQIADGHALRCHLLAEPQRERAVQSVVLPVPGSTAGRGAPLLAIDNLQVHFPIRRGVFKRTVGHVRAVDGVSLQLARGRTLALVGESGCGKTTVGKAVLRLIESSGGTVALAGQTLNGLSATALQPFRRRMQMVFQDPFASLNPRRSVGEIVLEGMDALSVGKSGERRAAVAALLQQVGLDADMMHRYPHEFSGGQRQRIAIARALAVQPEVIVCDEPTSALDVSVQAQILNLLRALQNDLGLAYLFITHNFAVVEFLADSVAVMYLGRIVEQGPVAAVLNGPRHPYTRTLLESVPKPQLQRPIALAGLSGEPPSPSAPPSGCHFHPRCPNAQAVCREQYPPLTVAGEHSVRCHFPA